MIKKQILLWTLIPALLLSLLTGLLPHTAAAAEPTYSVMSPVGSCTVDMITQAPRLDTLDGKTIAIVGRSFNAVVTQQVLKECILADYRNVTVYTVDDLGCGGVYSVFHQSRQSEQFQQKLLDYGVDAVISGNCGCGLCTVKESGSAIAAEYIGIPTVTVGATSFIPEIHSTGVNRGVPVLRTAEYPGAFSADTREELKRKSREIIYPLVVKALTEPISNKEIEEYAHEGYRKYDDVLVSGDSGMLQTYLKECGYTDGMPVNLPTKEKVEDYLRYTAYEGDEIIGVLPLAYRECRVYTVAVNAVMAGCPAEYMPLCVAFAQCMSDGEWRRTLASTHGWSPYAWLNGPLARQLGIDCGQGMISETNNRAFARFIELAMLNLGGYYIKENRMGTFGYLSPWVFSEDEEACLNAGWEPYHVTQGYALNDNTLTAASALAWGNNVTPATPDAEQIMTLMAWDITEKEQNGLGNTNPQVWRTVFVTEPVADNLSEKYATKEELEDALIATARRPLWLRVYANYWANTGSYQYTRRSIEEHYALLFADEKEQAAKTSVPAWLAPLFPKDSEMVTVATMSKGQTPILVCGDADRNKFQVMPGGGYATMEIRLPDNWDALMKEKGYEPLESFFLEGEKPLTGPIEAPEALTDGYYRILASAGNLTAEGRLYFDPGTHTLQYWANGAQNSGELIPEAGSGFEKVLCSIGAGSSIVLSDGVITEYTIRPPTSVSETETDASDLTAAAFAGASLTLAVTLKQNSKTGGVTPDGRKIRLNGSVSEFGIDLGGSLFLDADSTEGFATVIGSRLRLNPDAPTGARVVIGAKNSSVPGTFRTFTVTKTKGGLSVLYTVADTLHEPVPVSEECSHSYRWVTDRPATCSAEGEKHEECVLCGDRKVPVSIPKAPHSYGKWTAGGGTHSRTCPVCGDVETEPCRFDDRTHRCVVCGGTDPSFSGVTVTVKEEQKHLLLFKWYQVRIEATENGRPISSAEYSEDGINWKKGTLILSADEVPVVYVRVKDSDGELSLWVYEQASGETIRKK